MNAAFGHYQSTLFDAYRWAHDCANASNVRGCKARALTTPLQASDEWTVAKTALVQEM